MSNQELEDRRITYEEMLMFCTIHRDRLRHKNKLIAKLPFEDVITYMQFWYDNNEFPCRQATKIRKKAKP